MVNNNWDYDKLFAVGNVVGVKYYERENAKERFEVDYIYDAFYKNSMKEYYANPELKDKDDESQGEIQYIIKLDEEGNVVEKLFNRKTDMKKIMPKLENGYFVEVEDIEDGMLTKGVVVNDVIIYQDGLFDWISYFDEYGQCDSDGGFRVVKIWKNVHSFNECYKNNADWSAE